MVDENSTQLKDMMITIGIILLFILAICFIIAVCVYFLGFTVNHISCYKDIADDYCGNNSFIINNEIFSSDLNSFRCCNNSSINLSSRNPSDSYSFCTTYLFIEEDRKKCTVEYLHFKRVE